MSIRIGDAFQAAIRPYPKSATSGGDLSRICCHMHKDLVRLRGAEFALCSEVFLGSLGTYCNVDMEIRYEELAGPLPCVLH